MGTGSNACLYDGEKSVASGKGGGFIIGDEGGGANLGKRLIADYVKNLLPTEITEELERDFGLSYSELINKVYRMPMPNRYLASFAPYIAKHKDNSHIRALIEASFDDFITRNILQYDKKYPMNIVGSMAYYFEDILRSVAQKRNVDVAKILKSPIDELVKFQLTNYKK
jgi:N-acetylglucosamine kinase-like BadF-type ATPase